MQRLMGSSDGVYVLFASFTQASVSGRGALKNGQFFLTIPDNQQLHLKPFEACDGVKPSQPIKVYQTETILLYSQALNRTVGPLLQADAPKDPTRVVRWLYSSGNATVLGRCTGLNTSYDLTLHQGWNAVLTATEKQKNGNGQLYTNVREQLPYWLSGDFKLDRARSTLPAAFFEVPRTMSF
ncbi:hypothetical protein MF271_01730 (plasmid) [Deinococcus sp. KNUC1210]|uniref:hypothetical protein n=1 Tax=Deinococcus sp. KNUC1210 TaxID=2917691 RepID=UPI001EF094A0|nr:hypothetical protein [Deinococcus sp. KNUC1210]ULH14267.1 hypothetical protein MF271_01730 [Deinococcus sp. KNUC1210]